jgi:hypothetical protein
MAPLFGSEYLNEIKRKRSIRTHLILTLDKMNQLKRQRRQTLSMDEHSNEMNDDTDD